VCRPQLPTTSLACCATTSSPTYELWLAGTPLADRTHANYRRWVAELVENLAAGDDLAAFLSPTGEHERRALLTDWRRRLVDRGLAPATINLALAAATSLGAFQKRDRFGLSQAGSGIAAEPPRPLPRPRAGREPRPAPLSRPPSTRPGERDG
jgi:hypothetical protein